MNRLQFSLTILGAGLCAALLGASQEAGQEAPWDPREGRSALLTQQASAPATRALRADVTAAAKWRRRRALSPIGDVLPGERTTGGARLSLVSFRAGASTAGQVGGYGPDLQVGIVSVSNGTTGSTCSTTAIHNACSADWTGDGSAGSSCSTGSLPAQAVCSAGSNNSASGCSTYGPSTGTINCSATAAAQATQCSTNSTVGASCSANGDPDGSNGQQCSTGVYSGVGGAGTMYCSTAAPTGGGTCSVNSGGAAGGSANTCSADGGAGTETCSALSNGGGFCSIAQNQTNAQCTVIVPGGGPPAPGSSCSAFNGAAQGSCSIQGQPNNGATYCAQ